MESKSGATSGKSCKRQKVPEKEQRRASREVKRRSFVTRFQLQLQCRHQLISRDLAFPVAPSSAREWFEERALAEV